MHILYLHQHFSTPKGAAGIRSYQMAQRLLAEGHKVTMLCGSHGMGETGLTAPFVGGRRRGVVDGIDVVEFDLSYSNSDGLLKRTGTFFSFVASALKICLREPYDLAFATTTPLTAGIPVIAARWLRGKRYVFEVRDLWPELPKAMGVVTNPVVLAGLSALEWLSYRNAERCVALSPGIEEGIRRRGVAAERIAIVPNGCDIGIFDGAQPWRPGSVRDDQLLGVFTGAHGQANGLHAALDAAAVLKARGRDDIVILLVGDGKMKSELMARATVEGLGNVQFHAPVQKAQLAGLMAGADIGLQLLANVPAFYYGTSPNKFFDYLAAGLPVLTNYPGWVADLVKTNNAGYAVPPENAEAFADALMVAADNRAALSSMGAAASRLAKQEFDREVLSKRWAGWVAEGRRC
jgi:glycosyltransferase involved in cell wall biosynthesis